MKSSGNYYDEVIIERSKLQFILKEKYHKKLSFGKTTGIRQEILTGFISEVLEVLDRQMSKNNEEP